LVQALHLFLLFPSNWVLTRDGTQVNRERILRRPHSMRDRSTLSPMRINDQNVFVASIGDGGLHAAFPTGVVRQLLMALEGLWLQLTNAFVAKIK